MKENKITVVGLFRDSEDANSVLTDLHKKGYDKDHINVIAQQRALSLDTDKATETDVDGAETGATVGAWTGGLAGLVAGLAAITVPGLGPVITVGNLIGTALSTAAGAGIGAAGGGLIGYLADLGINEEDAQSYAEGIKRGGVLVAVDTDDKGEVERIFADNDVVDIQSESQKWTSSGWENFDEDYDDEYPTL